jgi:glycosyltransferase involved in cell wall biosynthesis
MKQFGYFPEFPPMDHKARPSVCIVTAELVGLFKNGGIGTSMTGLAQCLAKAGFPVTILYSGAHLLSEQEKRHWLGKFATIGITLEWLNIATAPSLAGPVAAQNFGTPFRVWQHLNDRKFDIIQFNDCLGDGYICLAMARLGLAFKNSRLLVALHSPSQWVYEINRTPPHTPLMSAFNYAERVSTQCADMLWSPSHYLLNWVSNAGFDLPNAHYVQQYAIPYRSIANPTPDNDAVSRIPDELVFFGRLEERKGLRLFCSALNRLNELLSQKGVKVTFMGKLANVADQTASAFLNGQSAAWQFPWQIKSDLDQSEAISYLQNGRTLAVMASPADNSPCTVYEALDERLTFLAARTGGIPELIYPQDRDTVLFEYNVGALCDKIEQVLERGIAPARPAQSQAECRERWIGAFAAMTNLCAPRPQDLEPARTWTALVDHYHDDDLATTITSLKQFEGIEQIIVLNHSPNFIDEIGLNNDIQIVNLTAEGCRDLIAQMNLSGNEAVVMLRAGTRIRPECLRVAEGALRHRDVDGLLPMGLSCKGELLIPLGGSPSFAFWHGVDLGGGVIVKADRLLPLITSTMLAPELPYCNLADVSVSQGLTLLPLAEILLQQPNAQQFLPAPPLVQERLLAYSTISSVEHYYVSAQSAKPKSDHVNEIRRLYNRLLRSRHGWLVSRLRQKMPLRLIKLLTGQSH